MATSKIKAKYQQIEYVNVTIPNESPIQNPSTVSCYKSGNIATLVFMGTHFSAVPVGTVVDNIVTGLPSPQGSRCVFNLFRAANDNANVPLILQLDGRLTQNSNNGINDAYYNGTLVYICKQ